MTSYFLLTLFGLGCGCRAGRAGFWRLWGDRHHGRHILWLGVPLAKGRRAGGGESRFLDGWRFGCGRGLRGWRPLFQTARGRRAEAWTLPKGHKHRREVRRWTYTRLYYRQWEMQFEQQIVKVWNQTIILEWNHCRLNLISVLLGCSRWGRSCDGVSSGRRRRGSVTTGGRGRAFSYWWREALLRLTFLLLQMQKIKK